jgi:hypothetical protein
MKPKAAMIAASILALAACDGDPTERLAKAEASAGETLAEYSSNITDIVSLGSNADLVQRFCKNAFAAVCPADVATRLGEFGFVSGGSGVDLANAFVVWVADEKDGNADLSSTDEDYLWAAYKVALSREPDESGALSNLTFIKDGGARRTMLRSMLESQEFKSLE